MNSLAYCGIISSCYEFILFPNRAHLNVLFPGRSESVAYAASICRVLYTQCTLQLARFNQAGNSSWYKPRLSPPTWMSLHPFVNMSLCPFARWPRPMSLLSFSRWPRRGCWGTGCLLPVQNCLRVSWWNHIHITNLEFIVYCSTLTHSI
jgi:hypothetical protein